MDIATYGIGLFTPAILGAIEIVGRTRGISAHDFALAKGSAIIDLFLLVGFLLGVWMVPRFGRIRMQAVGFAGMAVGMFMLLAAVGRPPKIFSNGRTLFSVSQPARLARTFSNAPGLQRYLTPSVHQLQAWPVFQRYSAQRSRLHLAFA